MPPPRWVPTSLRVGQLLEDAAHDQPRQRQRIVHRAPDAGGQPVIAHPLLAEADRRRMDHHRHVELAGQLEERHGIVVVRIAALEARCDPGALEPVLLDGALELAQERVAAVRHRRGHADDRGILGLLGGVETILPLAALELLLAIHVAQIVQRIGDDGDVHPADLGGLERVLDRGRDAAALGGADVAVESGSGEGRHVLRRQHMHVKIDDHRLPPGADRDRGRRGAHAKAISDPDEIARKPFSNGERMPAARA